VAMPEVYVAGIGTRLPGPPVDNEALAGALGVNREWIEQFIGTRTRHFARDPRTGETRWSLADLCARAAERALADCAADPARIEFAVLATATPDALMPATVNLVADQLGLNQLPTYQLQSGCAGAVQALDVARSLIQCGRYSTGLVLGGDSSAKHLDVSLGPSGAGPAELVNHVLFGDGAGAAVLSAQPEGRRLLLSHVLNRLIGTGLDPGQTVEWFGAAERGRQDGRSAVAEDYKAVEQLVPTLAAEIVWEMIDDLGWDAARLDFLLPPQLSGRMTARIVEGLGLPGAKEISCVADTGNTGNALPFFQLERLADVIAPGQRALAAAVESSKWIKAGFALEAV
jgi:3-oxoacyl-[acyl-carrier-protein] synthase-3